MVCNALQNSQMLKHWSFWGHFGTFIGAKHGHITCWGGGVVKRGREVWVRLSILSLFGWFRCAWGPPPRAYVPNQRKPDKLQPES